MNFPEEFRTQRLRAHRMREEDSVAIFEAYASDPKVTRFLPWKVNQKPSETMRFTKFATEEWERGSGFTYTLRLLEGNEIVGSARLSKLRPDQEFQVEIGFLLAHKHWGQGLGPEIAQALGDLALENSAIYRVSALVDCENGASCRALEKGGFVREALVRSGAIHPNKSSLPVDLFQYARIKAI